MWVNAQFRQPVSLSFQGTRNPRKGPKALEESDAFSTDVSPQAAPPKTLTGLKKRLKNSFEQLGLLPFLHSMALLMVSMVGTSSIFLGLSQNENVRHSLRNPTPQVLNLPRIKFQHYFTMSMVGLNLGVLAFFVASIARLTQKTLREKHAELLQAEAQEAYLATRPETEPHQQRMAQGLQNHIRTQLSAMATEMANTAQNSPQNSPMVQAELASVFGLQESSPSVERLTQLFHYLTTTSIRHTQQQSTDGQPPAPLSESEYLIKMAALVELTQLRGNLFEGLAEEVLAEEEEVFQDLEPRLFKLLALAETRMRHRAEQLAEDLQETQSLKAQAQLLRDNLNESKRLSTTPDQLDAVNHLGERLHLLTHRRYPPVFRPEEVEALGLTLPLDDLQKEEATPEMSQTQVDASDSHETLSARLDDLLLELNQHVETTPPQTNSQEA